MLDFLSIIQTKTSRKILNFFGDGLSKDTLLCVTTSYLNHPIKTAMAHRSAILRRFLKEKGEISKTNKENLYGENIKRIHSISQKQKYLNDNEINLLIASYLGGKSVYALAEQFGCHRTTVSNALKKHNVTVNKNIMLRKINVVDEVAMYKHIYSSTSF